MKISGKVSANCAAKWQIIRTEMIYQINFVYAHICAIIYYNIYTIWSKGNNFSQLRRKEKNNENCWEFQSLQNCYKLIDNHLNPIYTKLFSKIERRLSTFRQPNRKNPSTLRMPPHVARMSQWPWQTKLRTSYAGRIIAWDPFFRFSRMMSHPMNFCQALSLISIFPLLSLTLYTDPSRSIRSSDTRIKGWIARSWPWRDKRTHHREGYVSGTVHGC